MLQRRQWPHKCPYSDADKAILSLNTMQSTHVDSLHFKWRKMLFHTEKEKRVFRPGRCVLRRERARNSSTNLRFCLSVCLRPRPESILSACWITLHSDTLAFVHSSNCEERKEASNEDLAKHTKIGVLGLFGQTYIALPRYRSIHQTNVNTSEAQLRSVPTHIFSLLYWKMMAPHFPSVLLKEHIRSFLVSVILGTIRSIWIVEVFVLKK